MNTFFTGCTHFSHKNILDFEERPFDSVEEMDIEMIKIWNNQVANGDTVFHIGDFCLGNYARTVEILEQLNGKIILIKGNHDYSKTWDKIMKRNDSLVEEFHSIGHKMKHEKNEMWLTHYPFEIGVRAKKWSIHSHIHSMESTYLNQINVGVDSPHFKHLNKPFGSLITLEEVYAVMQEREAEIEKIFLETRGH